MKKLLILSLLSTSCFATKNYYKNGKSYIYIENENNYIDCTAAKLCDLALLEGDVPKKWIMSDGSVWADSIGSDNPPSYKDNNGIVHAIIQSTDVSSGTNDVILQGVNYVYKFSLRSTKKSATNNYVFLQDEQTKFEKDQIVEESIDFSQIKRKDTKYYTKGDTDSYFNPTEIFNDGKTTYVRMPNDIDVNELPSIKTFSLQGNLQEASGCMYKRPFYVCKSLYARLALVSGSEENQDDSFRVNIYRGTKPSGWSWLMQQYSN